MSPEKISKSRRGYTPSGILAPKQREVAKLVTRFESAIKREDSPHRRAPMQWNRIANRLDKSRAEKKGSEDSFPSDSKTSLLGKDSIPEEVLPEEVLPEEVLPEEVLPEDVPTRPPLGDLLNVQVDNKNTAKGGEWEDEVQDQPEVLDLSDKENTYSTTKSGFGESRKRPKRRNALSLQRNITEETLDLHETTQFPLQAAKIPNTTATRNRYTMYAAPPKHKLPPIEIPQWGAPKIPAPKSPLPPLPQRHPGPASQRPSSVPKKLSFNLPIHSNRPKPDSKWGPSGPPPVGPLPVLPHDVAKMAKMMRMEDQVRNRKLRAEEKEGMLKRGITAFDMAFDGDKEEEEEEEGEKEEEEEKRGSRI